jgi:hypothetical protein
MDKLPEWVTAIGTVATAGGVLFLWKQLKLMRIQVTADHERSRRENSINYLFEWTKGLLRSSSLARRLVEVLDERQTKALVREEELTLSKFHKDLVLGVLSAVPPPTLKETADEIHLDKRQVAEIRWQVVRYMNILESIFVAARHKVADKNILVEQFDFLFNPEEGHYFLKKFREAMGGAKAYPALSELEEELKARHDKRTAGLPEIETQ